VIEWLNAECTRARITIGYLWWKRAGYAELRHGDWLLLDGPGGQPINGTSPGQWLEWRNGAHFQHEELMRRATARAWRKLPKLPRAKLLK